jgi:hypothetical protein
MAAKPLLLNPGAQQNFVFNSHRASAFVGGLGSGKTYALNARGLVLAQQPKVGFWGPRGCLAAINYPVLKDVVLPQFLEMVDGTGLLLDYKKNEKKALLVPYNDQGVPDRRLVKKDGTGASEVLFRSLDQPNWMRGLELSWFGIDEGRHIDGDAWNVLYGRLRQKGYKHAGFVCSTPNGFDWMWTKFHPDSNKRVQDAEWYGAPTFDNTNNLPAEYIDSLLATYEGRFLRQEVYGEFVGVVDGAVFFEWDMRKHVVPGLEYNPDLPLYSFWDFGMGDLGVVVFGQIDWVRVKPVGATAEVEVPFLTILDSLESTDRTSEEWAKEFKRFSRAHYGREPQLNICDPAGRQRNVSTGRTIVQDLAAYGVNVAPAPKKPIDYAIRILNNMMAGDRVKVSDRADRVAAAFASHKWPVDSSGTRTGANPVHDWTSHFCDAVRYGVTTLLVHGSRKVKALHEPTGEYSRDQWGYIMKQMLEPDQPGYLGAEDNPTEIDWQPASLG